MNFCFVCGYDKLKFKPYADQPEDAVAELKTPDWPKEWGLASGEVCDCCGFQYGHSEGSRGVRSEVFHKYLGKWVEAGLKWKNESKMPKDWSLIRQLKSKKLRIHKGIYVENDPNLDLYKCIICGWPGMESTQFARMPEFPQPVNIPNPFEDSWGFPSYDVCCCCSYEAGNDDSFEQGNTKFAQNYLVEWFEDGAQWLSNDYRPSNWDLVKQLKNAGIQIPQQIKNSRVITGRVDTGEI